MKSGSVVEYVGNELELFKHAVNWKRYFSRSFGAYIQGDVLEVGAGNGINSGFLFDAGNAKSWTCIEPDAQLAAMISEKNRKLPVPVQVINGLITDTTERFDTIIYIDVLEHIEDPEREVEEITKRLKNGGHLIILVPAYNYLYSSFDKKIGHFRRYNKKMLQGQIQGRLQKKALYYLDSIGFFASVANKLFLKKDMPSLGNILLWDRFMIRLSLFFDILFFRSFGKSLIGVFRKENA